MTWKKFGENTYGTFEYILYILIVLILQNGRKRERERERERERDRQTDRQTTYIDR